MKSNSIQRLYASAPALLRFVVAISPAILVACGSPPAPNDPATATNSTPTTTPETTTPPETTTASATTAATATGTTPATINASKSDSGKTLEAKVGDTVVLSLEENPSTGYAWRASKEPDAAVLKIESSEAKSGKNTSPDRPGKVMLGVPGTHEWTLRATGAGTTTLTLDLMPPGGKTPAETVTITVHVAG